MRGCLYEKWDGKKIRTKVKTKLFSNVIDESDIKSREKIHI